MTYLKKSWNGYKNFYVPGGIATNQLFLRRTLVRPVFYSTRLKSFTKCNFTINASF